MEHNGNEVTEYDLRQGTRNSKKILHYLSITDVAAYDQAMEEEQELSQEMKGLIAALYAQQQFMLIPFFIKDTQERIADIVLYHLRVQPKQQDYYFLNNASMLFLSTMQLNALRLQLNQSLNVTEDLDLNAEDQRIFLEKQNLFSHYNLRLPNYIDDENFHSDLLFIKDNIKLWLENLVPIALLFYSPNVLTMTAEQYAALRGQLEEVLMQMYHFVELHKSHMPAITILDWRWDFKYYRFYHPNEEDVLAAEKDEDQKAKQMDHFLNYITKKFKPKDEGDLT